MFVEVHEAPERALSDGANALRLDKLAALIASCSGSGRPFGSEPPLKESRKNADARP